MDGKMWLVTALCLSFGKTETVRVHRVKAGETVVLPCFSNDDDHRFQYWEIGNDKIVGPWNNHDHNQNKYKYEVWSGKLIIKVRALQKEHQIYVFHFLRLFQSVSTVESGFYKCISKKIKGIDLNAEGVELIVFKDWEESFEHDSEVTIIFPL